MKDIKNNDFGRQEIPGKEYKMDPPPVYDDINYVASEKLKNKVAIITGGDSGIGRAVAVAFAKELAKVVIVYDISDKDARKTKEIIESYGQEALLIKGDISNKEFASTIVEKTIDKYQKIDILINNAGKQFPQKSLLDISQKQLEKTFKTNVFSMFYLTQAVIPHLKENSSIINTSSVTAYRGNPILLDYSSSKGAVTSFTRSLSINLSDKKIRVNQVAPGPIWTPLIVSTFDQENVESFGKDTPLKRAGQPSELAGAYVFLASDDSAYISGQTIHVNGGEVLNG